MNKHIIAFLSVFSLGVILSIYYVLIPINSGSTLVNGSPLVSATYSPSLYFESLISERREEHEVVVSSYQDIIVSDISSKEEKETALKEIEKENNLYALELTIDRNLATLGYMYSCTKIISNNLEKSVNVIIYEGEGSQKIDKVSIMYMVLNTINDNSFDVSLTIHH